MSQTLKTLQSRIKDINSQIETETDVLAELSLKVEFPLFSPIFVLTGLMTGRQHHCIYQVSCTCTLGYFESQFVCMYGDSEYERYG